MTKVRAIVLAILLLLVIALSTGQRIHALGPEQKIFTAQQLSAFDGTDPNKPVYLAMNGLVYDVTGGREFYQVGGPYHDLAGKESGPELNVFGGAIIKRKYPVIGKLSL